MGCVGREVPGRKIVQYTKSRLYEMIQVREILGTAYAVYVVMKHRLQIQDRQWW